MDAVDRCGGFRVKIFPQLTVTDMIGFFDKLLVSQVFDPLMSYALFGVIR